MTEEVIFKTVDKLSRARIADNIRKIAEGVEKGNVSLKSGGQSVDLEPAETSELEIKVEEESGGDISLELEIEWNREEESNGELEIG